MLTQDIHLIKSESYYQLFMRFKIQIDLRKVII